MITTAQTRYQAALANEIADELRSPPHTPGRITVRWDNTAETYAVRVTLNRQRYDLYMPAPGACYGLFRNGKWVGGMNTRTDATPCQVATALLNRIAVTCQ